MEPLLFPDELEGHVQDGFCLPDLLGHYINTGGLPGVLSGGHGSVVGQVPLPEGQGCSVGLAVLSAATLIKGWSRGPGGGPEVPQVHSPFFLKNSHCSLPPLGLVLIRQYTPDSRCPYILKIIFPFSSSTSNGSNVPLSHILTVPAP